MNLRLVMTRLRKVFAFEDKFAKKQQLRSRFRPGLERMEDRVVPAAMTWQVDDDGMTYPGAYTSITAAIAAAAPGDTIVVAPGTYPESVAINKTLTLLGAQANVDARTRSAVPESIMDGNGLTYLFTIGADNVVINGFQIQGQNVDTLGPAIYMQPGTSGSRVTNNIIQNNLVGIFPANDSPTSLTVIEKNLFRNNNPVDDLFSGYDIYADQFTAGLGAQNIRIDSNTFTNTSFFVDRWAIGVSNTAVLTPFENWTISNNVIDKHGRGIYLYNTDNSALAGNSIDGVSNYAIGLFDGNNNVNVSANRIENGTRGIWFGIEPLGIPNASVSVNGNAFLNNSLYNIVLDPGAYLGTLDASANYWGTSNPAAVGASILVSDALLAPVDYTPLLDNNESSSAVGFQANLSSLTVHTAGAQAGLLDRIQEGINVVASGGTVNVLGGTYLGNVDATANAVTLAAAGGGTGQVTVNGNFKLDANDTFTVNLNGSMPGTGFDQWIVNGIVNGVTLNSAMLTGSGTRTSVPGQVLVLIENNGIGPVVGTFVGTLGSLPEGSAVTLGGVRYIITYQYNAVGIGNDVALIDTPLPAGTAPIIISAPSTTFTVGTAGTFLVKTAPNPDAADLTKSGTLPAGVTFVDNGNGTATLSGVPLLGTEGTYVFTITASNDVAPNAVQTFTLIVQPLGAGTIKILTDPCDPTKKVLVVTGTANDDCIEIERDDCSNRIEVEIEGRCYEIERSFNRHDFDRIIVYGLGGDDHIEVDDRVTQPAMLFGGAGCDYIQAGGGPAVLVGGTGDDTLVGGAAANILISGTGRDQSLGKAGMDILIAGTTAYDNNICALWDLLEEWSRTDESFYQKVANIKNGSVHGPSGTVTPNGSYAGPVLNSSTVQSDGSMDCLSGGSGLDWYFANLSGSGVKDRISDLKSGEIVTEL